MLLEARLRALQPPTTFEEIKGSTESDFTEILRMPEMNLTAIQRGQITTGWKEFCKQDIPTPAPDLKWPHPHQLVSSVGKEWTFQRSEKIMEKLKFALPRHWQAWREEKEDKKNHPLFLVFSGPGTGKSRLLDEFQSMSVDAVENCELKTFLANAAVFKVTLENGSTFSPEETLMVDAVIGSRMMAQMSEFDFEAFRHRFRNIGSIEGALQAIPRENDDSIAVFLIIDGLQMILPDLKNPKVTDIKLKDEEIDLDFNKDINSSFSEKLSRLYVAVVKKMQTLANRFSKFFVVPVIAATVYVPTERALHRSPQDKVLLGPLEPLKGHEIIQSTHHWVHTLVEDTGGHGRALEALWLTLKSFGYFEGGPMRSNSFFLRELFRGVSVESAVAIRTLAANNQSPCASIC
jgi:hypothetical protein